MEENGLYSEFHVSVKKNLQYVSKLLENDIIVYDRWNFFVYFE